MQEQTSFYNKLYTTQIVNSTEVQNKTEIFLHTFFNIQPITEEQKLLCEGSVTDNELLWALKLMKNNKTPRSDGFPADFYNFFFGMTCIFSYRVA